MIRLFNHYLSVRLLLLTALEAFVVFQSVVLGFDLREANPRGDSPLLEATTFTAVMLLSMSALGLYQIHAEPFRTTDWKTTNASSAVSRSSLTER